MLVRTIRQLVSSYNTGGGSKEYSDLVLTKFRKIDSLPFYLLWLGSCKSVYNIRRLFIYSMKSRVWIHFMIIFIIVKHTMDDCRHKMNLAGQK